MIDSGAASDAVKFKMGPVKRPEPARKGEKEVKCELNGMAMKVGQDYWRCVHISN
jgi:hypothetical protein